MLDFKCLIFVFVFVASTVTYKEVDVIHNITTEDTSADYILCRGCGSDISVSNYIISKTSPVSQYSFNDTVFNKDDVLIQVLSNDIFFHFPVITSTYSTCAGYGEWEVHDSWFPGYRWKPCLCPDCGAYVGLIFEPINPDLVSSSNQLFGLIMTSLISETFTDSLTKYPESLN